MKLILIGVGFFPRQGAGDKNFFARLIPLLASGCESIDVVSINDRSGEQEELIGDCRATYHSVKRACHLGDTDRFFSGEGEILDYHHKHKPPQEVPELLLTTLSCLPALRRLVRRRNADVIHFMDNMGPSMRIVKKVFQKVTVTHSAMAYAPRGRFYDRYLCLSMRKLDRVVSYSEAYARVLVELGLEPHMIAVIRWGVEPKSEELSSERRAQIRATYGVPDGARLLLWSGFIQQIGEDDFEAAVEVARSIVETRSDAHFVFAFKPSSYREAFKARESEAIRVVTNVECFPELLETADFFYSPLLRQDIIVAPPLTWLEAMSMGTPVITTAAGGVDDVVLHGDTGFVSASYGDLPQTVSAALDHPSAESVGRNCRALVARSFDIRTVADRYLQMWRQARAEVSL